MDKKIIWIIVIAAVFLFMNNGKKEGLSPIIIGANPDVVYDINPTNGEICLPGNSALDVQFQPNYERLDGIQLYVTSVGSSSTNIQWGVMSPPGYFYALVFGSSQESEYHVGWNSYGFTPTTLDTSKIYTFRISGTGNICIAYSDNIIGVNSYRNNIGEILPYDIALRTYSMDAPCTDIEWYPDESTVCSGISFTQESNCGNTRGATGTKLCISYSEFIDFKDEYLTDLGVSLQEFIDNANQWVT